MDTIHLVGNLMIDTLLANLDRFDTAAVRAELGLPERYVVATLHRPANVDDPEIAAGLVRALHEIAAVIDVVIPVHPRGRAVLEAAGLSSHRASTPCPRWGTWSSWAWSAARPRWPPTPAGCRRRPRCCGCRA